MALNYRI